KLADYRKWTREGRPAKAVVKVLWGPRTAPGEHAIAIGLGADKDGKPLAAFTRKNDAGPGKIWTEAFPVACPPGDMGRIPYQVKTTRPASPVEELAEAVRERTESFTPNPLGPSPAGSELGTGTVVTVEWEGMLERPNLPAWKGMKAPALPVSLPKVGD